ncbi:MAG: UbiH/UbiF family hydroxylase [Rhodobacteraceae bacterium]|nr:UbiH/UbiF family hydroxylase [Paracoccaceae bacterium]
MRHPQPALFDVIVSGGGVAGLTAAAAFGSAGFSVLCVDPAPPITEEGTEGADLRSTAFLQPARRVLEEAGLWARLEPHAAPLQIMRIVDAGGAEPGIPREVVDFDAADISDQPFGWNLPNWLLRREMAARLSELEGVTFRPGVGTLGVMTRTGEARVRLSDGSTAVARLLVAADGRDSPVRKALGIDARTIRYGQKALAFTVTHPIPHNNVSTEIHRSGGPFTLVPLPDRDGRPHSAIVWMEDGPRALELAALSRDAFEEAMNERSCRLYGPLTLESRITIWPIISQNAVQLTGERTALVAEAAHVLPPIGAQGLNMSLRDIATLLDLAREAPADLGSAPMLARYAKARAADVHVRVMGIDLLNRASQMHAQPLRDLRRAGLKALYGVRPVRRSLMQLGLGAGR